MSRSRAAFAAILGVPIALAACGPQEERIGPDPSENRAAADPAPPPLAEPPPMVVRSPAYRCDDGRALYVDVMSDEGFVNVRDARPDIPVRLDRNPETEQYEGQGRTLSGAGEAVRYSAPGRPDQACRVTAGE